MRSRDLLRLCCLSVIFYTGTAFAQQFNIQPKPALSSDQYGVLSSYLESADGVLEAAGGYLRITYSSSTALNGYIAVMDTNESYNPADMYHFTLPAAADGVAMIDLRALTTWAPFRQRYYVSFLSAATDTDTRFAEMVILPAGIFETVTAGFLHLFTIEPYWVSSAHLLRGYKVYGIAFSLIAGCMITLCFAGILLKKRTDSIPVLISLLVAGSLLYSVRFTADFGIVSVQHLHEWWTAHTYSQAGDMYSVADAIKEADTKENPAAVSVCFSSTDYYAKLLRYLAYPVPVTMTGTLLPETTHIVVSHQLHYSESGSMLHCGGIDQAVVKMKTYPDGTILYSVTRP